MEEVKGIDGTTITEKRIREARECFETHTMKEVGPGHWHMRRKKDSCFWCDIAVLGGVGLVVWGDIQGLIFSYYSCAKKPEELVHWMAKFDPYYYCRQKASIGMGGDEYVDEYEDDVAIYDLRQHLKEVKEGYTEEEWFGPVSPENQFTKTIADIYTEAVNDAIGSINCGENLQEVIRDFADDIKEIDSDAWEWLGSIGRVPSCRLIWCLAAIERLSQLLSEEEKEVEESGKSSKG